MLSRRGALQSLGGLALAQAPARKPNFVILFADDLGYGDIGCFGSPDVPTPHIDSLARNGVRCTDGYVSAAVCSPSRAALLTGRYQHRFGHEFNSGPPEREARVNFGLPPGVKILPQMLTPAGYVSGMFGKWHLGVRPGYHPLERGFDEFYGFLPGANAFITERTAGGRSVATSDGNENIPATRAEPILRGKQPVEEDRYLTEALAAEATGFIERHRRDPFLLYLPFNAVHTPLHATDRYVDRFASIKNVKHRHLAAMTAAMDDAIGAVLRKLRETGLEENTLIFFLSDNGCPVITGAGTNAPLSGEKVTYYEGGIRVPFIAQWKGRLPAGVTYRYPVVSRDIAPTFLAAAGVEPPADAPFDGVDLLPYFRGQTIRAPHRELFWRCGPARAVRRGRWKLLEFGNDFTRLFDLAADIGEKQDLASRQPWIAGDLRAAFARWEETVMKAAWPPRYRELTVHGVTLNWEL